MSNLSESQVVVVESAEGVTTITLNRPQALNALNVDLLRGLVEALGEVSGGDPVVVRGAGRAFCVGEDLKQTLAPVTGQPEELREAFELLQEVTRLMVTNPQPVIAAVQGFAIGGGAEIALAADLVIMDPATRLRFPEVPIGHAHTGGITLRLPALVGLLKAKELLLTGRWVEGSEALDIGLANELNPDPFARAVEVGSQLAKQPKRSMAASKRALELSTFPQLESNLRLEVESALYCFASEDAAASFEDFRNTGSVAGAR